MFNRNYLIYILLTLFSCSCKKAGPIDWNSAEKSLQFNKNNFVT